MGLSESKDVPPDKTNVVTTNTDPNNMPSVGQCDTSQGNLAALPSTLELFDKFKSISENGKDSDSEESFHLPLDDDDIENQSIISNGRDKDSSSHNEETEDDILNKFETNNSVTPDQLDPKIEESILADFDDLAVEKDSRSYLVDIESIKKETETGTKCDVVSKNIKNSVSKNTSQQNVEGDDSNEEQISQTRKPIIEVKLTWDYGCYEDSVDGEFKSIYETELCVEAQDAMEITEEDSKCKAEIKEEYNKDWVDNPMNHFEDSMEVDERQTKEDIAHIIENLEDQDSQDARMEGVLVSQESSMDELQIQHSSKDDEEDDTNEEQDVDMEENLADVEDIPQDKDDSTEKQAEQEENDVDMEDSFTGVKDIDSNILMEKKCGDVEDVAPSIENNVNEQEELEDTFVNQDTKEKEENPIDETVEKNEEDVETNKEVADQEDIEEHLTNDVIDTSHIKNVEGIDQNLGKDVCGETENLEENEPEEHFSEAQRFQEETLSKKEVTDKDLKTGNDSKDDEEKENVPKYTNDNQGDIHEVKGKDDLSKELDETINKSIVDEEQENCVTEDKDIQIDKDQDSCAIDMNDVQTSDSKECCAPEIRNVHIDDLDKVEESSSSEETSVEKSFKDFDKNEVVFKVPEVDFKSKDDEEPPEPKEEKEGPDKDEDKSNDNDEDLLDISIIRDTEEDDACAIADAIEDNTAMEENDKEAHTSEKSDEEQSERTEVEQDDSEADKDNDNDDNEPLEFDEDDDDDDTNMETIECDHGGDEEKSAEVSDNKDESESRDSTDTELKTSVSEVKAIESKILSGKNKNSESAEVPDEVSNIPDVEMCDLSGVDDKIMDDANNLDKVDDAVIDKDSDKNKTDNEISKEPIGDSSALPAIIPLPDVPARTEMPPERQKSQPSKRSLSAHDVDEQQITAKKPKLHSESVDNQKDKDLPSSPAEIVEDKTKTSNEKVKTLTAFSKFMQCRKFTSKLTRSDLEQFCIQKICESLMLKSSEGELHQTIKKQEKTIDNLRKDLQQLTKQSKDLEIVNKKLMNELRNQNSSKKPLVPLKITRSVGLQVRLNPGNETPTNTRRRQPTTTTPQKQPPTSTNSIVNNNRTKTTPAPSMVRQVAQSSPQKSPLTTATTTTTTANTTPLLTHALTATKRPTVAKRTTTPARKMATEPAKSATPANPGVIDLTDEDDKSAAKKVVGMKLLNKTINAAVSPQKITLNKVVGGKAVNQGKTLNMQTKSVTVGNNKTSGTTTRTVTTLPQGIRLTPGSVITSSAGGSPQMLYVLPTISSNSGGPQKVAFVNLQPTNGVISTTLNGSTVSVIPNKNNTLTLKTVANPMRNKHPAPLPISPRVSLDPALKPLLPKPHLTIKKIDTGIILQWKMPYNLESYESIASYQLYAYQETNASPSTDMWRKVGDVKALALPMACTLTQFADKNKYYFAVRSVDVHKRIGAFSDPEEISL